MAACFGGAATAHAQAEVQVELTSEIQYVEITGETFLEVFDSINSYVLHNQEFSVDVRYNFLTDGPVGGPCPISWGVIVGHTVVRLPRWAGERRPPRRIRRDYESWEEGMLGHGQDHIEQTRMTAERLAAQLSSFAPGDDCSAYQAAMHQASFQVPTIIRDEQVEYHNNDPRRHRFNGN